MNNFSKFNILLLIITICFAFVINFPSVLYSDEANAIENSDSSIGKTTSSVPTPGISKNSTTYKILVVMSIISLIIVVIAMRSMIFSLFAYIFIISSIIWTIYSTLPLFKKTPLTLNDFIPVIAGIVLTIVGYFILQIVNGKNIFGSSMKSGKEEGTSSRDEYDLLLRRAKLAFMTIKRELGQGKLDKTSVFTSDELFEQISINLDAMKTEKYLLVYDDLRIKKIAVKKKAVENHLNNIYVEIIAFGTRYKTDIETKKIIEGSEVTGEFTEIFCLSRQAGCKAAQKGLIEGVCPRCGTPIKGKRTNKCSKCNNELRSGEFDVFLSAISYPN